MSRDNFPESGNSSGLSLPALAIDVGYGETKFTYRVGKNKVARMTFPSLTPICTSRNFPSSLGEKWSPQTYSIKVGDVKYEVGPGVMSALGGTVNRGANLSERFPETPEYEALVVGSIAQIDATHIEHLVLGLPIMSMGRYSRLLENKFARSTFTVSGRRVFIKKVSVFPQIIGTLVFIASKQNRFLPPGEIRLIIDVGYYTTNWIVADGFQLNKVRSSGTFFGVFHLLRDACKSISVELGIEFADVVRLSKALRENSSLQVAKYTLTNPQLREHVSRHAAVLVHCLNEMQFAVGTMRDISEIYLTGGGSPLLLNICKNRYPDHTIYSFEKPEFANVFGLFLQAEN